MSVEQQSYTDIEHIIQDGGSRDGTLAIAQRYKERAEQRGIVVRIASEPDSGLYDAMNKALKSATGDYVCFLNAGDKLHGADTLLHVSEAVGDADDVCVVYGDTDIVDNDGRRLRGRRLTPPQHLTWESFKDGMLVCHQSFYANREVSEEYNLNYRFSADFDWCVRVLKAGDVLGMRNVGLKEVLTDYLSEGMTTANHKASLIERFRIMAHHYGLWCAVARHVWFVLRAVIRK